MDFLFLVSIFFFPFENFVFAPSAGWAAIAPITLFVYVLFNYKYIGKSIKNYGKIFGYLIFILIPLSCINYLLIDKIFIENIIGSMVSLILGITNLLAFDIFFIQKKKSVNKVVKVIIIAYVLSIIVGIIQIIAIKLNVDFLKNIFSLVSKRNYVNMNKVQFTFTEPSYIGMHLFGILLPIYYVTKDKRILKLIIVYTVISLLFSGSIRLLVDIIAVLFIVVLLKNVKKVKTLLMILMSIPFIFMFFRFLYFNNTRIKAIVDEGIYADSSLASRYFRINAAIHGYCKKPINFWIGYGLGNSILPIKDGYVEAYAEYKNKWKDEVERIGDNNYSSDSESLCFFTKVISDFGFITLIALLYYIFKLRRNCNNIELKNFMWILLYLYIQFESYAFYTLWLYIVFLKKYGNNVLIGKND